MNRRHLRSWGASVLLLAIVSVAAPAAAADLEATALEVTQTIQDFDNQVRLVAKKNTWVRIHARSVGADKVANVVARISVKRTSPGPTTLLGVIDSPPTEVVKNPIRNLAKHSLNIQLPYSWRSGTLEITATVDFGAQVDEDDEGNNTLKETVSFETVPPLRLRAYGVKAAGIPNPPAQTHYDHLVSWLRRAYPTSALVFDNKTLTVPRDIANDVCSCIKDSDDNCLQPGLCLNDNQRACDSDMDCGCGLVNEMLLERRMWDQVNDDSFEPDRRYVGMVDDVNSTKFMRGCSPGVEAKVASGPTGTNTWGWDTDGSYGDWYTAHELGHTYGRPHALCCGAKGSAPFPYPNCEIGDGDEDAGFDTDGPRAYSYHLKDNMSYCNAQWLSDFTFESILDQLILEDGAPPPPPKALGNFAIAIGKMNLSLDTARIDVLHMLPSTRAAVNVGGGDWELRFLDATGGILSRHPFTPSAVNDERDFVPPEMSISGGEPADNAVFAELIAVPAGAVARLALFHQGVELASRTASANPPTVTLTAPNGGESIGRSPTVQWDADDLDGDSLRATVLYSADSGDSWEVVGSDLTGTSATVDLTGLAGGTDVLFRVLVSDGFYTSSDESDAVLTVSNEAPQVHIVDPGDGAEIVVGQMAMFEGLASDAEDGAMAGDALVWSSDRQGTLGIGANLALGDELVPGTHVITLTAIDADGASATATVTILKGSTDADTCPAYPRGDCQTGHGSLRLSDRNGIRKLSFGFVGADAHDGSVFGDPTATTSETLCLYEAGRLHQAVVIAPSPSLWRRQGERGYRFRNAAGEVENAQLKAGTASRPRPVTIRARGEGAGLPGVSSPLDLPVVVQWLNDTTPTCFGAELGSDQIRRNQPGSFRAR